MGILHSLLIGLVLLFQGPLAAAPEEQPSPPPHAAEVPILPPKPGEPVFPVEDLIGKPTPETDRFLSEFISMLATLGLIIASILLLAWFLKRMVNAKMEQVNTSSSIKIIDKRSLSPRTIVYMIEVNGKGALVAESHNGIAYLGDYPPEEMEEEEASGGNLPTPFSKLLSETGKRKDIVE